MAIHNLGFRNWDGVPNSPMLRWAVITQVGVKRAWQSAWLRRMLIAAWLPAVGFGILFFFIEQWFSGPPGTLVSELRGPLQTPIFQSQALGPALEVMQNGSEDEQRHVLWSLVILTFFRASQPFLMFMLVGIVAPPLISQDVRSRAFLLYFSRPLTRSEYVLGKMATIWAYLIMITAAPALALYVFGVLLSPGLGVVLATWDLPFRIITASAVLMLPTSALALSFSSLTQESRYAGFAWFAMWILGMVTYWIMFGIEMSERQMAIYRAQQAGQFNPGTQSDMAAELLKPTAWSHVSLYHTLGRVQEWIFGFSTMSDAASSMILLLIILVVATGVLFRRVSAPMRV